MPKERHTVLREALAAIEATDREVEAARAVSEARGSSYCRYVLAIISRNDLEAWMLFPERARAEHSR